MSRASDADRRSGRRRDAWRRSLPSVCFIFANVSAIRPSRQCGYVPSKAARFARAEGVGLPERKARAPQGPQGAEPRVGCAAFRGRAPALPSLQLALHKYPAAPRLLVMRPHPKHLDNMDIWQDLIHQPVLDVDSPRNRSFEVPDENFIWRRSLKRV